MIWKGKEIKTYGDLVKYGIDRCDTPEEAREFMELYRAENPYADQNIGYISGYFGPEKARRVREWFGVAHPVFRTF